MSKALFSARRLARDAYEVVPFTTIELMPCCICGLLPRLWRCGAVDDDDTTYCVMCRLAEDNRPNGDDCPLAIPSNAFFAPRKIEAAQYWNQWMRYAAARKPNALLAAAIKFHDAHCPTCPDVTCGLALELRASGVMRPSRKRR